MKKIAILSFLIIYHLFAVAQDSTSLHQNFDVACVTAVPMTHDWITYTSTPDVEGAWVCAPSLGRDGSNCVIATNTYSSSFHVDTSYIITPKLNLSGFSSSHTPVYLNFDTKVSALNVMGDTLVVLITYDTATFSGAGDFNTLPDSLAPVFTNGDVSGWVTHQINISYLESGPTFRIAFRYTGSTAGGNKWYLDNVNTTTTGLYVPTVNKELLPLKVVGTSTSNRVTVSYTASGGDQCHLALYDMMGRILHTENISAQNGVNTYTINNIDLLPGMYFVKMSDGDIYGATKVMIR